MHGVPHFEGLYFWLFVSFSGSKKNVFPLQLPTGVIATQNTFRCFLSLMAPYLQKKKSRVSHHHNNKTTFRVSRLFRCPAIIMSVEASVAALEIRATTAENQLKELQSKAVSSDAAVSLRLKELLALMQEDRKEAEEIRATRDELKEENSKLRAQVGKLEYRVVHLLRTIHDIEAAAKK